MQEKAKARLRELAHPPRPEGARRRDSSNLSFAFSCMSVRGERPDGRGQRRVHQFRSRGGGGGARVTARNGNGIQCSAIIHSTPSVLLQSNTLDRITRGPNHGVGRRFPIRIVARVVLRVVHVRS